MRARRGVAAAIVLIALGRAGEASAQSTPDGDRFRISVNGGVQLSSIAFDTSATRVVYLEDATIGTSYTIRRGLAVDGGLSVRVAGNFGVGVTVSSFMATNDADVSGTIPHPFFFRTPRTITGTAPGLRRDELVTHLQAIYTLRPGASVDVSLSAGPSFFRVRQAVVYDVAFSDTYPYDRAAFASAASQQVTAHKTGFNAGADVGLRLSRHAGVGGGVRFSQAVVSLGIPNSTTTTSVDAGGVQFAGGLRLSF